MRQEMPAPPDAPTEDDLGGRVRLHGSARALVLEAAAEIRADWSDSAAVVGRVVRMHKGLSSRDRRLLSETVYGLVRFDRRLDATLDEIVRARRGPLRELSALARDRVKLLLFETQTSHARDATSADLAGKKFEMADEIAAELEKELGYRPPSRLLVGSDAGLAKRQGIDRDAVRFSFPTWILERLSTDLGAAEALAVADALNRRAPLSILANRTRVDRGALLARLREEGVSATACGVSQHGITLDARVNVRGLASFKEGLFEVMDEGSQLVCEVVDAGPAERQWRSLRP